MRSENQKGGREAALCYTWLEVVDDVGAELPREVRFLVLFKGSIIEFECTPRPEGSQANGEFEVFVDLELGDHISFPSNSIMI